MKIIIFNAVLNGIRAKIDKSLGLTLATPELSTSEKAEIMNLQGINLDVTLKPLDIIDAPEIKVNKDIESKSQSQRIRSVLFLLWKQEAEPDTFDIYYHHKTEKYIEFLKDKLED